MTDWYNSFGLSDEQCIVEELGELAHDHLKQAQGIRTNEDRDALAKDAVADIVIFLADYCSSRGFDLEALVSETWAEVRKRDRKANPEGGNEVPCVCNGDRDFDISAYRHEKGNDDDQT